MLLLIIILMLLLLLLLYTVVAVAMNMFSKYQKDVRAEVVVLNYSS